MFKDNIKSAAITYKGYDYQTLFGISILADWLKDQQSNGRRKIAMLHWHSQL